MDVSDGRLPTMIYTRGIKNMDRTIQEALYKAALKTAQGMGADLLKMSYFVSNWDLCSKLRP